MWYNTKDGETDMSLYLSWIEGSPPKRNAGGSIPPRDVI